MRKEKGYGYIFLLQVNLIIERFELFVINFDLLFDCLNLSWTEILMKKYKISYKKKKFRSFKKRGMEHMY